MCAVKGRSFIVLFKQNSIRRFIKNVCKKLKSVNIWQSYKQQSGCLMHFARLANTLLKDKESTRDSRVFDCIFDKYLPILNFFHSQTQRKTFLTLFINNPTTPKICSYTT